MSTFSYPIRSDFYSDYKNTDYNHIFNNNTFKTKNGELVTLSNLFKNNDWIFLYQIESNYLYRITHEYKTDAHSYIRNIVGDIFGVEKRKFYSKNKEDHEIKYSCYFDTKEHYENLIYYVCRYHTDYEFSELDNYLNRVRMLRTLMEVHPLSLIVSKIYEMPMFKKDNYKNVLPLDKKIYPICDDIYFGKNSNFHIENEVKEFTKKYNVFFILKTNDDMPFFNEFIKNNIHYSEIQIKSSRIDDNYFYYFFQTDSDQDFFNLKMIGQRYV